MMIVCWKTHPLYMSYLSTQAEISVLPPQFPSLRIWGMGEKLTSHSDTRGFPPSLVRSIETRKDNLKCYLEGTSHPPQILSFSGTTPKCPNIYWFSVRNPMVLIRWGWCSGPGVASDHLMCAHPILWSSLPWQGLTAAPRSPLKLWQP